MSENMIEKIKVEELIKRIEKNEYDFLGMVISGWHLNILYSYLNANSDSLKKGIIIIASQNNIENESKFRIKPEMIKKIKEIDLEYVVLENNLKKDNILEKSKFFLDIYIKTRKKGKSLKVFLPLRINYYIIKILLKVNKSMNISFLLFDEGNGSYINYFKFCKNMGLNYIKIVTLLVYNVLFPKLLIPNKKLEEYFLYKNRKGILIENRKVAENLKKLIEDNVYGKCDKNNFETGQILILKDFLPEVVTDNYNELKSKHIELYFSLIKNLKKKYNLKIYIKKHPNDLEEDFDIFMKGIGAEIIYEKIDAEEIYCILKPKIVAGGLSTAIFAIATIFEKRCFNFSKCYNEFPLKDMFKERIEIFRNYFLENDKIVYIKDTSEI